MHEQEIRLRRACARIIVDPVATQTVGGPRVALRWPLQPANTNLEGHTVDWVDVMVEIPRGSRNKYEYDKATGRFYLDRMLFSAVHYPADYGFIPETLAEDGDELDALVLVGEATFPGCIIRSRPIGVFHMWDEKGPDAKILAVPISDPQWNWAQQLEDVPRHLLREITHFFSVYKDLEDKKTKVGDWEGRDAALRCIDEARARFAREDR